jgi:hypothetical protein
MFTKGLEREYYVLPDKEIPKSIYLMTCDTNTIRHEAMLQLFFVLDNWVSDIPYVTNKTENTSKAEASKLSVLEFQHAKYWPETLQQCTILTNLILGLTRRTEAAWKTYVNGRIILNLERIIWCGIGLEVNADEIKYMIMSRDQNAGRSHNIKIDNSSFERVGEFKYLVTNLTIRNSIQEEIKSKLKSQNACYNSVQNRLSS